MTWKSFISKLKEELRLGLWLVFVAVIGVTGLILLSQEKRLTVTPATLDPGTGDVIIAPQPPTPSLDISGDHFSRDSALLFLTCPELTPGGEWLLYIGFEDAPLLCKYFSQEHDAWSYYSVLRMTYFKEVSNGKDH